MSLRYCLCSHVIACVTMSLPVSSWHCLCSHAIACVPLSLPVSPCHCLCSHGMAYVTIVLPGSICHCLCPHGIAYRGFLWIIHSLVKFPVVNFEGSECGHVSDRSDRRGARCTSSSPCGNSVPVSFWHEALRFQQWRLGQEMSVLQDVVIVWVANTCQRVTGDSRDRRCTCFT